MGIQRITISIDDPLAEALDAFLASTGYRSRSEGIRDLIREVLGRHNNNIVAHQHSVATLSYIYDRRVRRLASRLSNMQHANHELIVSTISMPLDHNNAIDNVMLRGNTRKLQIFADGVRAERGVKSVVLNLVGVHLGNRHEQASDHDHVGLLHLSPTIS